MTHKAAMTGDVKYAPAHVAVRGISRETTPGAGRQRTTLPRPCGGGDYSAMTGTSRRSFPTINKIYDVWFTNVREICDTECQGAPSCRAVSDNRPHVPPFGSCDAFCIGKKVLVDVEALHKLYTRSSTHHQSVAHPIRTPTAKANSRCAACGAARPVGDEVRYNGPCGRVPRLARLILRA